MGLAAVIVLIGVLSLLIARAASLPPGASAFILTTSFMNAGNYGLSGPPVRIGEGAAWAVLFFITSAMMTNSAGVYLASLGRARPLAALVGLMKVPSLYAIPLALLLRTLRVDLPLPLVRPIELLAGAAIPSMLLLLGMNIGQAGIPTQRGLLAGSVGSDCSSLPPGVGSCTPLLAASGGSGGRVGNRHADRG
jgi:predicted permease